MQAEVIIPASLTTIAEGAFKGCNEDLIIKIPFSQEEWPEGWADDWFGNAQLEVIETEKDENDEDAEENDQNTEDADEERIGRD